MFDEKNALMQIHIAISHLLSCIITLHPRRHTNPKKQNLEKTLEIVPEKNSEEEMEQKLKDLLSMKERNVISDEEYNEMRKKILGL